MSLGHAAQKAVDTAAIGAGLTAPWWVPAMTTWLGWIAALFAALLAIGRFVAFVRDWRNGKKDG